MAGAAAALQEQPNLQPVLGAVTWVEGRPYLKPGDIAFVALGAPQLPRMCSGDGAGGWRSRTNSQGGQHGWAARRLRSAALRPTPHASSLPACHPGPAAATWRPPILPPAVQATTSTRGCR